MQETPLITTLKTLVTTGTARDYLKLFKNTHEADIAEALETLDLEEKQAFFSKVKPELGVEVLEEMHLPEQVQLFVDIKTDLAAKFLEEMEPDDAADLIEELQESHIEKAEKLINALPEKEAEDIIELLSYPENSAGAIMTSEYLAIPENLTIKDALTDIKNQNPPNSEIAFYIYIVNKKHKLVGYTTLRNLVMGDPDKKIKTIRKDYPIKAVVTDDQEEVAKLFQKYDMVTMPVVNDTNELVGLITVDDIVDVVVEEATEDLYKLSGTSEIEESKLISGNIIHAIISRSPWLILTILGGILASYLITTYSAQFDHSLFPLALSLSFIPMLMGLGGNVGNQSATITVRGLSTGHIKDQSPLQHILRETLIGLSIGGLIAAIVFVFNSTLMDLSPLFTSIVSLSIVCNITAATFIGTTLPLLFNKLKIDPAVASAPFISTALDIIGQIIYFTLTLKIIAHLHP